MAWPRDSPVRQVRDHPLAIEAFVVLVRRTGIANMQCHGNARQGHSTSMSLAIARRKEVETDRDGEN